MSSSDQFRKDELSEITSLTLTDELLETREEAVGLTIDGETSKDLDDAIYVETHANGYRVQVSVADVAALVRLDTKVYAEALRRVDTQYHRDYTVPMLPRFLSEDRLSLLEDERRPALTFFINLSAELEVEEFQIRETVIRNRRKLSYPQVDYIISHSPQDRDYRMLVECNNLADRLLNKRRMKGALAIYDLKRHIFTDEEGHFLPLEGGQANRGNLIVQELMILTNQSTAKFFAQNNVTFLFRNHTVKQSTPDRDEIMAQFNAAMINPNLLENLSLRTALWFNRATYDPILKGHFGLNEVAYSHVTSPIRRVPDLINHHIIKAFIHQQPAPFSHEELAELSQTINDKITEVKEARSEYFKGKAMTKAQYQATNTTTDGLVEMDSADFRLVLKQVCRSGIVGDDFEQALMTRFDLNLIDVSHLYTIFFDMVGDGGVWGRIRNRALDFAKANPGYSNQLLNLQTQKGNLSHYQVEIKQNDDGFLARVVASSNAGVVSTPYYTVGPSKKDAQHRASYDFLIRYLTHDLVPPEQTIEPNMSGTDIPPEPINLEENYVGQLNDICVGRVGWSTPHYEFEQRGPSHQPIITCEVKLDTPKGTMRAASTGTSKKMAKQLSAKDLMYLLKRDGSIFEAPRTAIANNVENYIGRLNELCQKQGWELPNYEFEQSGPSHNPYFSCVVVVATPEGERRISGEGTSKKVAKQVAANNCMEQLTDELEVVKIIPHEEQSLDDETELMTQV